MGIRGRSAPLEVLCSAPSLPPPLPRKELGFPLLGLSLRSGCPLVGRVGSTGKPETWRGPPGPPSPLPIFSQHQGGASTHFWRRLPLNSTATPHTWHKVDAQ